MKKALADALEHRGYETLTPVQEAVTKSDLGHADLLVSAQTGSGKTVGFGLAIADTVLGEAERFDAAEAPVALIIAPTRELAMQVKRELSWLYAQTGAVVASCVGGMDMRDERRALARGAHFVVATPGRLRDHIMRGSLDMDNLRAVVLDEADEMLDLGFREDLEFILGSAPEGRRTLLFSATVPSSIERLAKSYQKDAVRVVTKSETSQHADIEYRALQVSPRDSENALINVLRYYEAPNALVFCHTRAMVNRLTTRFSNRGFSVVALSGELSQAERSHALQAMRDGRARVCVATDVAARGIDLPNLELVIHAELPSNAETMLHRSGRTGRAGRKGVSALIVPPKARRKAESLLRAAKVKSEWAEAPSADAVLQRDEERLLSDATWEREIEPDEAASAKKLTDLFSTEQIAVAFLRLHKDRQSAPEELSAVGDAGAPRPRAAFGPSVWFSVAGGRAADAEPRRLLPMLCKVGNLTKEDIGAIRVQNEESFVELRQSSVAGFLAAIGQNMTVEDGAKVVQLKKPPAIANSPRPAFKGGARDRKPNDRRKPHQRPDGRNDHKSEPRQQPRRDEKSDQSYAKPAPQNVSRPTEWDDAPAERKKKPKGAVRKKSFEKSRGVENTRSGAVKAYGGKPGPGGRKPAGKAGGKPGGKPAGGKSVAPKVGKPNSKKNKARRAAALNNADTSKRGRKPG